MSLLFLWSLEPTFINCDLQPLFGRSSVPYNESTALLLSLCATLLNSLHILSHLIHMTTLGRWCCFYALFTKRKLVTFFPFGNSLQSRVYVASEVRWYPYLSGLEGRNCVHLLSMLLFNSGESLGASLVKSSVRRRYLWLVFLREVCIRWELAVYRAFMLGMRGVFNCVHDEYCM